MATQTKTETLLEVKNLSVDYFAASGTVHAVREVSFTLNRGEILGLAGESGCGKSTLAFGVARLLRPPAYITGGEVIYHPPASREEQDAIQRSSRKTGSEPVDIMRLSPAELRAFRWNDLAVVFQSAMNSLNPVMSIGAQIMDVLKTHRPDMGSDRRKKRAAELLELVGIAPDRLKSYPHELSGGMRQRAAIAIALALNPEIIIMDEPTTALDVVVQREILQLISSLCKELSTALIFITHDLSLLIELADKIAIMYAGTMIEKSSSVDIYTNPRHPYSFGLLNSFPNLRGPRRKMAGIPGTPPDLRHIPTGCPFQDRCPLVYDQCRSVVPELQPATPEKPNQLVACHLYDKRYQSGVTPTKEVFAQRYEALAGRE
ncbi:peptide/nickel transport system ATP-binding protein [Thermosporothrix hazakensis]|jgi:peptide/nickel transport system ATP-binding protein|uniref:Peptide/nickel transport system ATP-binding protein n=2 Tax=Thermosporothrix TaxID=768650 RepID=A0A326UI56_THEHA|nr:ABC transporter ATP-binding protein [Thermosporothrix hazakensis]PZW36510.1 peptide/nickel transport system ATP-binding protein [Thermosporothrix hazakensis]BBH88977.1 dipeptide/oligopeptide/nickel ABC transporter ATP-binding protein [Thermosporothrix sp. COM3]GCE47163.1 dipeptide/oligopeptide/nickel ABC transporter ATP-binding protein [Thermosporothrix hazakensis]